MLFLNQIWSKEYNYIVCLLLITCLYDYSYQENINIKI